MANPKIIPKKSVQAGKIPQGSDLESGEICINHADKKLYSKHPSTGAIQEIGSLSEHSHDELYSLNGVQHIELQNNGSLLIEDGVNPSKTFVFPSASGTLATLGDITAGQQADWNATSGSAQILNKPTLATVATSGSYSDLSNKPTIPAAQVNSDWSASTGLAQILNKPTLSAVATSGSYSDLSGKPTLGTAAATNSTDYATAAQGALAATASQPGHTHSLADLTQSSATSGQVPTWNGTAWVAQTPAAGGVTSVAGRTGAVTLTTADISGLSSYVKSDTTGVANSTQLSNMIQITQAGYNAITPNANTLYVIVG